MKAMQAKARIGEGTLAAQQDDAGVLRARVTDAGALARFLDLYSRMEGGELDVSLHQSAEGGDGAANVSDFVLRDEPALAQLAAAGQAPSATGIGERPALEANAAHFDKCRRRSPARRAD